MIYFNLFFFLNFQKNYRKCNNPEKNLIANKQARINEQEAAKIRLDAEINRNKELTIVADKLKEDLEILNQRNQEIANKLERNIKEIQVAEKREVQLEKSWLYKLFN